jgi:hypothetical protein
MGLGAPGVELGSGGLLTVLVLASIKRVRDFFRNLFRDWVLMRGQKAIAGLRAEVRPLRERMARAEEAINEVKNGMVTKAEHAELVESIGRLAEGQGRLAEGQGRLDAGQTGIVARITRNGGDTPELGDSVARLETVTGLIAEKLGINLTDEGVNMKRREGDG